MVMNTNTKSTVTISSAEVKTNDFGFKALSEIILFRRPVLTAPVSPEAPRVILLFAFYNAPIRAIQKVYIRKYLEKWPSSSIIVFKSIASWFVNSRMEKDRLLMPAIEILLEEIYEPTNYKGRSNGLLVHVISNGGGFTFTSFMDLLERTLTLRDPDRKASQSELESHAIQKDRFEPLAIILDSCPSSAGSIQRGSAFIASIKSPLIKSAALVPVSIAFSAFLGSLPLLGMPQPFATMNARLLRNDFFPGLSDSSTPRLYFYSTGDAVVDYRDVEAHLRQIRGVLNADQQRRSLGEVGSISDPISVQKFGLNSTHVMHVRTDTERYWAAIDRLWWEALKSSGVTAESVKSRAKL